MCALHQKVGYDSHDIGICHTCIINVKAGNVQYCVCVERMLCCWQISLREAYKGSKKVGLNNFTRKTPASVVSHPETANNVHGHVSHKPAAAATVAMTTTPAAAASPASDRTATATSWPQVCRLGVGVVLTSWPQVCRLGVGVVLTSWPQVCRLGVSVVLLFIGFRKSI